jgi:hypothetical protein
VRHEQVVVVAPGHDVRADPGVGQLAAHGRRERDRVERRMDAQRHPAGHERVRQPERVGLLARYDEVRPS